MNTAMNQKEAAELWPIIKAWAEDKRIQVAGSETGGRWEDVMSGPGVCMEFRAGYKYRIKPKPMEVLVRMAPSGKCYGLEDKIQFPLNPIEIQEGWRTVKFREVVE